MKEHNTTQNPAREPSGAAKQFGGFAPGLVSFTDDVLFGQVWIRPELSPRDRSLVTVAVLAGSGNTDALTYHLGLARENGVTEAELIEAITHLAFYAGWPRAMAAMTVAKQVFAGHSNQLQRGEPWHEHRTEAAHPQGTRQVVHRRRLHRRDPRPQARAVPDGVRLRPLPPGARTAWHSHAVGQTLYITEGTALIGTRDGNVITGRPGQVIYTPPGEEHWHGAAPDSFMVHIALYEGTAEDDGAAWLEHVTSEQYNAAAATASTS